MDNLKELSKLIRYYILKSTTQAGSGHPSSSLSAVELMTVLFFGGFLKYDLKDIQNPLNDRVIFSKGHASPLLYALWTSAGVMSEKELLTYRKFGSVLEGHPTPQFPYAEVATGSLGQGLSIGVGYSLNAKLDELPYKTFVLLGDSEMAEGSVWEAIQLASYYKLSNLIGILDVNRLGQRGETMLGHNVKEYAKRVSSFGWETIVIDGHSVTEVADAYSLAESSKDKPVMIIAKTIKGKGVSFMEDKIGWHGKTLPYEKLGEALKELEDIDKTLRGHIDKRESLGRVNQPFSGFHGSRVAQYNKGDLIATRKAYGETLVAIFSEDTPLVVLDAEVSNSTYSEIFKLKYPERFFEMYIAEQNMVGVAIGLSKRGKIPFASTFAAFWSRAHDQIRMAAYSNANIKFVGSHAGVSIGEDGPSQMGLEDISMFRSVFGSAVLYPSDAVSCAKLTLQAANTNGIVYLRTTRKETPVIYENSEEFPIGGSKTLKESDKDGVTVVGAGITIHEALLAHEMLKKDGINVRVIDMYSVKPIDCATLEKAVEETGVIVVVEDHYPEGGIADAVRSCLSGLKTAVYSLAVSKKPRSGTPEELLNYEEISSSAIVKKVKEVLS
ncbi:MAG: transketolase [Candidatus Levybacteria bacterium RIFOXYA1_FULL_41_10]|nr:MAG: Transketolase [Candidatus Levybacteria bacterium GW2011_GWA1_39_34]KKR51688.1 MAG: Transketolase [Candidatus Levybacteria bacterium GW2011_GWC1_40_19]KKR72724.1 MAG: Transketolase [Candidatus Levybacteria bacterium GW2011_GWC2_40_7]KKR94532.1 MAG: Transketolase [Candidatus Levybacteria bacterium GW2011_GWA2_41_15]KKS01432.1 MAG: Transketolase [Candidatus Levybacteria bacterium GW2011_GWB1_41_21]OGH21149.1 MAG: transketolase [Candidatus Levybacteria bacterium RIFCSPHIGHO2_01_FULL_40_83]